MLNFRKWLCKDYDLTQLEFWVDKMHQKSEERFPYKKVEGYRINYTTQHIKNIHNLMFAKVLTVFTPEISSDVDQESFMLMLIYYAPHFGLRLSDEVD